MSKRIEGLQGAIFAAGDGSRIHRNKPLVETKEGKKLIEYPIDISWSSYVYSAKR